MQQLLEIAAKRRIVECTAAQCRAIELAIGADEGSAERFDDGAVAGLAAPADRVRDFVGVEDVRAQGRERGRHFRSCRCRCRR